MVVAHALLGAVAAFAPSRLAFSQVYGSSPTAMMSQAESVDTTVAADDVLESLLEASAPTGMRRKMAESLRQKQIALTDLVASADGKTFEGAPRAT